MFDNLLIRFCFNHGGFLRASFADELFVGRWVFLNQTSVFPVDLFIMSLDVGVWFM